MIGQPWVTCLVGHSAVSCDWQPFQNPTIAVEEGQFSKGKSPGGVLLSGEDKEDLVLAGKTNKKPNVWRLVHKYSA